LGPGTAMARVTAAASAPQKFGRYAGLLDNFDLNFGLVCRGGSRASCQAEIAWHQPAGNCYQEKNVGVAGLRDTTRSSCSLVVAPLPALVRVYLDDVRPEGVEDHHDVDYFRKTAPSSGGIYRWQTRPCEQYTQGDAGDDNFDWRSKKVFWRFPTRKATRLRDRPEA